MKARNSVRIAYQLSENEQLFRELLDILKERKEMNVQITLFMSISHSPLPLDKAKALAEVLRERMKTARKYGFESGINILCTIGQHEENLDNALCGKYTGLTNVDGRENKGSFCPNDENMRGYIEKLYRLIVSAEPDYIWVDDDVRFEHMPTGYGCFCDNCLDIFEKEYGTKYTREEIKAAFKEEESRRVNNLLLKWLQHNRNTFNRLFTLIEKTVSESEKSLKKLIPLGFMTAEFFYEGIGFAEIAEILKGSSGREVLWRPGSGVYTDHILSDLIEKSHRMGRQIAFLPPHVKTIQSEIENFPYQMIKKSPATTALEAASHIAAGCTGAAYNVMSALAGETPADFIPVFDALCKAQPFYNLLVKTFGRIAPQGVYTGFTRDLWAVNGGLESFDWYSPGYFAKELLELGFPAAYSQENSNVTLLYGSSVRAMSGDLIEKILSGGVYMDASALKNLNDLGYGGLTGFKVKDFLKKDCIEVFTDHYLNDGIPAGAERNCYQDFGGFLEMHRGEAAVIVPANSKCETLSCMKDYNGNIKSECSWGIFENSLGGRVCVAGYYPWTLIQSRPKMKQIGNLFGYLSKNTLPSMPDSYCRLYNWTRRLGNGDIAVALINGSLEQLQDTVILLKTDSENCVVYDMSCKKTKCCFIPERSRDGYKAFAVTSIQPWKMALVIAGGGSNIKVRMG